MEQHVQRELELLLLHNMGSKVSSLRVNARSRGLFIKTHCFLRILSSLSYLLQNIFLIKEEAPTMEGYREARFGSAITH